MEAVMRIIGVFLLAVAVIILAQAIIPGGRHELWAYINPLMAISIVLVVGFCIWSKLQSSDDSAPMGFPEFDIVLYVGLFIAYLFFFNWSVELSEGEGYSWAWIVINGMIPVLNIWAGTRLLTRRRHHDEQ